MYVILGVGILILILIYLEYLNNDCLNGKMCLNYITPATSEQSIQEIKNLIHQQFQIDTWMSFWRQALLVALIVCIPLIWFLTQQCPTLCQVLIVVLLVSVTVFFSQSWIFTHFTEPNLRQIEANLQLLLDKIEISSA